MEYAVAVYRSRTTTMRAYEFLTSNGFTVSLVSTPRGANVGCGISVKMRAVDLPKVREVLSRAETFAGFFLVKNTLSGTVVSKL